MVSSSGDLSSLTNPPLYFGAWSKWPGGFLMSQHAATLGWDPNEHRSQQQLWSPFAYDTKHLINGCFGSGLAGQDGRSLDLAGSCAAAAAPRVGRAGAGQDPRSPPSPRGAAGGMSILLLRHCRVGLHHPPSRRGEQRGDGLVPCRT